MVLYRNVGHRSCTLSCYSHPGHGWTGTSCARPPVKQASMKALHTAQTEICETHQSLLVLKRPVFGLVLHHCGNIPIEDPHKKEIRDSQESPANQSVEEEEEEEDSVLPPAISCAESNRFLYRKTSCMVQSEVGAPDWEPRPAVASQQRWWGWTAYTASLLHSHCAAAAAAVCLSLDLLDLRMFAFYSALFFRALVRGRQVACGSAEIVSDKHHGRPSSPLLLIWVITGLIKCDE